MEIAYPVLRKFGISAFWFVFSSVFKGEINLLEIYKYFYNIHFPNFDAFECIPDFYFFGVGLICLFLIYNLGFGSVLLVLALDFNVLDLYF